MSDEITYLYDVQAEQAVLGSCLIDSVAVHLVADRLRVEDFWREQHRPIWEAMVALSLSGQPVDYMLLAKELEARNNLVQAGGNSYLTELLEGIPTAAHVEHYAELVRELAERRRLVEAGGAVVRIAHDREQVNPTGLALAEVLKVEQRQGSKYIPSDQGWKRYEKLQQEREKTGRIGLLTGYPDLDAIIGGLRPRAMVVIGGRPAMGKCLSGTSKIIDPVSGKMVRIDNLSADIVSVVTMKENGRFIKGVSEGVVGNGIQPVYLLRTTSGREIEATLNHPFLVPDSLAMWRWRDLSELKIGDRIAVPRRLDIFGKERLPECRVRLLALLIADGGLTGNGVLFTDVTQVVIDDFIKAVEEFGGVCVSRQKGMIPCFRIIIDWEKPDAIRVNPVVTWLENLGLKGKLSVEKVIPDMVFGLEKDQLALFLNRLFACDGTVFFLKTGQPFIGYSSSSKELAYQVQHLLLRFGILSQLRHRLVKYQGGRKQSYEIRITNNEGLRIFCKEIGILGREDLILKVMELLDQGTNGSPNLDVIPSKIAWPMIEKAMQYSGMKSWADLAERMGQPRGHNFHRNKRGVSRKRMQRFFHATGYDALKVLAESDIYWDMVAEITYVGEEKVYDLSVPGTYNFIANDFIVHNSLFAAQIATNVARQGGRVLFASLEMSMDQLLDRRVAQESEVALHEIERGYRTEEVQRAIYELAKEQIDYVDDAGLTTAGLLSTAARMKASGGLDLIVVDYLQLLADEGNRYSNGTERIDGISRRLKMIAGMMHVPLIAVSQLSRAVESRSDKHPMLSDLRESGAIEQEAAQVLLLYRPEYYGDKSAGKLVEVAVAKNRFGAVGKVELVFVPERFMMVNLVTWQKDNF